MTVWPTAARTGDCIQLALFGFLLHFLAPARVRRLAFRRLACERLSFCCTPLYIEQAHE